MTYSTRSRNYTDADSADEGDVPIRRIAKQLTATTLKRCARLLPTDWRLLLWTRETDETIIACYGKVEIRQLPPCCTAQTCVKGEMDAARGAGLQRLAEYVGGENRERIMLEAERPVVQQRVSPGLWAITIRLPMLQDLNAAPTPHTPMVKVESQQPTTLAVISMSGHPTEHLIARGEAAVLEAIARTPWFRTGSPVVRMHVPCSPIPFACSFEVVVPVAVQPTDNVQPAPASRPASAASTVVVLPKRAEIAQDAGWRALGTAFIRKRRGSRQS